MIPLIGMIAHTELNRFKMPATTMPLAYTAAIEKAGGLPVILPFSHAHDILPAIAGSVQGFLFPGGNDIDPSFYNETPVPELGAVNKDLDLFQMAVLKLAIAQEKPVLAICRGIQLVNVFLGGTLVQDIPSQIGDPFLTHLQDDMDTDHPIDIEPGSRLHQLFGPHIVVNSRHHQSVKEPGKGFVVTARAPDGVIEAAEHKNLPIDMVQWHPERMLQKNDQMLPLFKAFIERCLAG
ncbi:gamma-glutamyl-gamma-aminobutyrate hydrolase family protein [Desulfosarcina sp.]|uniref:gamma-glutamyl-gamma-aminobutyrate hydrolase family protein n=1 Tax=Desulfosarcina sp. TaxID=2027861 RepID=UPI003971048F